MKKFVALMLAAALLLCGCEGFANRPEKNTANTANTASTEPEKKPDLFAPLHDLEDENEEAPDPSPKDPLTGEILEADNSANKPYAVVIDNVRAALPTKGLSNAGVIFEYNVEGNVTRLLALFQDISNIKAIGPVRSCRRLDVSLAIAFNSIYAHAGGSPEGLNDIIAKHIADLDSVYGKYNFFYRDNTRKSSGYEHTLFLNPSTLLKRISGLKVWDGTTHLEGFESCLDFGRPDMDDATVAVAVTVRMNSSKSTRFEYDENSGAYLVSEFGEPYMDGNTNQQLAVTNVIALKVGYSPIEKDRYGRLSADLTAGDGTYCTGGKIIKIKWTFTEENGFTFTNENGEPLKLASGRSFICLPDSTSGGIEASYLVADR